MKNELPDNVCRECGFIGKEDKPGKGFFYHITQRHKMTREEYTIKHYEKTVCEWCGNETALCTSKSKIGWEAYCKECLAKSKHPTQTLYWKRVKGLTTDEEIEKAKKQWHEENSVLKPSYHKKPGMSDEEAVEARDAFIKEKKLGVQFNSSWKNNYSKISQEMFKGVLQQLPDSIRGMKIYFATMEGQHIRQDRCHGEYLVYCNSSSTRKLLGKSGTALDFFIKELKLIIEFDGTWWHTDDEYEKNRDTFLRDIIGDDTLIIHVPEKQYVDDKEGTINELVGCITKRYSDMSVMF